MADVLFYVQHLLGIGHLRRAAAIVRALDAAGLDTLLVSGGLPVPGLDIGGARLAQLPPIKSRDASFSALVGADGRPFDEAMSNARRDHLLSLYREARPRVVIIEQFPFGRRQLRFELLPLIKQLRCDQPRPALLCSLRDIVNKPSNAEKATWMLEIATRFFDLVLVHGDPALVALEQSIPEVTALTDRLRYTGYVLSDAAERTATGNEGTGEVIVSTGGGAVAEPLVAAALAARPLSALAEAPWRILIGDNMPDSTFEQFRKSAPAGVVVERARPDFTALLARCRLSISQAGYNTVMELLRAGPAAVLVPFVGAGEREQSLRAELLAARGLVSVVPEASLARGQAGPALARGIAEALERAGRRPPLAIKTDGAAKTAEIVRAQLAIVPTA